MARRTRSNTQHHTQDEIGARVDCTALYIRVSTDLQAESGFSLDDQRQRLDAYCIAQDWTVCEEHIYIDAGISGKTADRPAYQSMLAAARQDEIIRIVAIKLDRLARNTREFLATVDLLGDQGCDLVLVKENFDTSTPHGKFALTMFSAIAELEASVITERTMAGRRQKASQGGYNGARCPLGYVYDGDGTFHVNGSTGTIVRIFDEFNAGGSLSGIAQRLNDENIPTATGAKWYPASVRYILRNGFYAGLIQYDDEETPGTHPAIVDLDVYERAMDRLDAGLQRGRPAS